MVRPQFCVYNQTSECFLSLGVTHGDSTLSRFKGLLEGGAQRYDEGKWVDHPKAIHFFRVFSSRDLVFLDDKHRVIGVLECFPPFRFAPLGPEVASVLALPVDTINSSQTQRGNQLVICVAEELEFRLRRMPDMAADDWVGSPSTAEMLPPAPKWAQSPAPDRRIGRRKRWPRLVAYDSMGGALEVHGVKDLSANGLYLITNERWPLGSQVTMTLQRTDGLDDVPRNNTFTVQLRVIRWGSDGVGLAFVQSETEESQVLAFSSAR
ncbi:MAG TPA: PilZ domain-containing protein [Terracidiphilus sp.]